MRIYEDLRSVQTRLTVVQYATVIFFAGLIVIFWHLQVVRGRYFRDRAENNRRRDVSIAAPRGVLLDRNGHVLVDNRPSFNVVVNPESASDLDRTVVRLSHLLHIGEGRIRELMIRRGAPFRQVVVKADADMADVAAVRARHLELPETSVEPVPLRSYPLGSAAAHVLGHVGEVTERQLQSAAYDGLGAGDLVGQAGVEAQYNRWLMGTDGVRQVIVNSKGLEVGQAKLQPPMVGPALTLSLDEGLETAMERAFKGRNGSAVALDPQTGEILAMTSIPSYDPNHFTTGIEAGLWNQLRNDPDNPLLNRTIQGQYAPGSVFKIVTTIAALETGVITPETQFHCNGVFMKYGKEFHCHQGHPPHGTLNLHQAFAQSCNVYFYNVGVRLEIDRIAQYANLLGLGQLTGIDLPGEKPGVNPSPEWKLKELKQPWYAGETVSVAIGQGYVTTTALQLARLAAAAGTGRLVTPHLTRKGGDRVWPPPKDLGFKPETLAVLRSGMREVVTSGTGRAAALPGIAVCGKTGTAQVVGHANLSKEKEMAEESLAHGWFVAFAPEENPRIALAVMVEHGSSGGGSAAPIAHDILAHFFGIGQPPPKPPTLVAGPWT
jgi:penicillin-binding protein 2